MSGQRSATCGEKARAGAVTLGSRIWPEGVNETGLPKKSPAKVALVLVVCAGMGIE